MAKLPLSCSNLIHHCEELIREGRILEAKSELSKIKVAVVQSDSDRLLLAKQCRRVGLNRMALRLLAYGKLQPLSEKLDSESLAEYALNLQRVGSVNEAIAILKSINIRRPLVCDLYLSYCYMSQWDYQSALPFLRNYIQSELRPYENVIGQINEAACLIYLSDWKAARDHLEQLIVILEKGNWKRLRANAHELLAQIHVANGELSSAKEQLHVCLKVLSEQGSPDAIFAEKWNVIVSSIENQDTKELQRFKVRAKEFGHWETIRDIDFQILSIQFDQKLLDRLYFGTPYPSYRFKLTNKFGDPSKEFHFPEKRNSNYDLNKGSVNQKEILKPGQTPYRLLSTLFQDLYRPSRLGEIFSSIYPGEHFDIYSSPTRIHQIVKRTRQLLNDHGIFIQSEGESYQIELGDDVGVYIQDLFVSQSIGNHRVIHLKQVFSDKGFTAQEAARCLELSHSNTNRVLKQAVEEGNVLKIAKGPLTYYKIA